MHSATWNLIISDLYRYTGKTSLKFFVRNFLFNPGFICSFYSRICHNLSESKNPFAFFIFYYFLILHRHNCIKYGIELPFQTNIQSGLYIGHHGGIIISSRAIIGKNCNISQGVTIGQSNRGKYKGYPTIGDAVYIGPGAKIFGAIKIGNNVAIGANCVVTKDIPDNSVVVGVPGKVISSKGSLDYINNTDYKFINYISKE